MSSFLDLEGVYDQTKRFIVRNWSSEDFTQTFGAESVYNGDKVIEAKPAYSIKIKAGEMRELGQFEAYIFTKHFVDREMYRDAEKITDVKLRERAEMGMNNKDVRKPYEDKTLQEIEQGKETPFMEDLKDKLRKEIEAENKVKDVNPKVEPKEEVKEPAVEEEIKTEEFDGLK